MNRVIFGPYSLFRIPTRPKAAFLDIDKTLILQGEGRVGHRTVTDLQALAADGCGCFRHLSASEGRKEKVPRCVAVV